MDTYEEPSLRNDIIELKDAKRYFHIGNVTVRAIDGIDIMVKAGDFITISGASGSGKTTMLNLMGLLDSPTRGEVIINGLRSNQLTLREKSKMRLKEIGFIFQFFNLQNNLTAIENVMIPNWLAGNTKRESERRAVELLDKMRIGHRLHHLPSELSGGQQQRVAIARALVNSPSVILADEPTGNLDSDTTREIIRLFEQLNNEGQTLVMVTHEKDITDKSERNIVLQDGKIVADHSTE